MADEGALGSVERIVFAPDGDLVAAVRFKGVVVLGGQTFKSRDEGVLLARVAPSGTLRWVRAIDGNVEQHVHGLAVADDGSIRADVSRDDSFVRITFTGDGLTQKAETLIANHGSRAYLYRSAVTANGESIINGTIGAKDPCKKTALAMHRLQVGGGVVWSVCTDSKAENLHARYLAAATNGKTALCAGAEVLAFSADGKRTLEITQAEDALCTDVAISEEGDVAVLVLDVKPTTLLATWKPDGTPGWTKICSELRKGKERCGLSAIASSGSDLLVVVGHGDQSSVVRLDSKTGAVKSSHESGNTHLDVVAANGSAIYIGASGYPMLGALNE